MRSDLIKEGPSRAPHRSLLRALGIDELEMKRPFVAVVNSKSDYIPGHMHLDKIAEQVKAGIRNAGGVPFEFNTIGVCDGIAMNHKGMKYSLCSRELIADSIEVMLTAHPLDAIVFIPNCDKIVPGMLLAACRLNLPCIFISGGPMLPGKSTETTNRIGLSEQFEYVGANAVGKMSDENLESCAFTACPTCGSCSGMYTANSMNCLTETIGMSLPGSGTIPAVMSARLRLAKQAGERLSLLILLQKKLLKTLCVQIWLSAVQLTQFYILLLLHMQQAMILTLRSLTLTAERHRRFVSSTLLLLYSSQTLMM